MQLRLSWIKCATQLCSLLCLRSHTNATRKTCICNCHEVCTTCSCVAHWIHDNCNCTYFTDMLLHSTFNVPHLDAEQHNCNFHEIWQFPVRTPWVQNIDFLLLLVEKFKMKFWANLIKAPKTKRCCFGRFTLRWSSADDKPLSFGSSIERAASITCPQKIGTQNKTLRFGRFYEILSKCQV